MPAKPIRIVGSVTLPAPSRTSVPAEEVRRGIEHDDAMNAGSTITSRDSHDVRHCGRRAPRALGTAEVEERGDEPDGR